MDKKVEKKNETKKLLWTMTIALCLITSYFVGTKYTTLATNIELPNSIIIYPFTFLFVILLNNKFGKDYAKKSVYVSAISLVIFLLGLTAVSLMKSNEASSYIRASIEFLFTPKNSCVGSVCFAYPNLITMGFSVLTFTLTHLIAIKLYNATKEICPATFSFGVCYFLSYIIDTIIYVGGSNSLNLLVKKSFNFVTVIRMLTAQFIGVLISGVVLIIVFAIVNKLQTKNDKNVVDKETISNNTIKGPEVIPSTSSNSYIVNDINTNTNTLNEVKEEVIPEDDDLPQLK